MNNVLKVAKYQLRDFRKSVMIYYSVILGLGLFLVILTMKSQATGQSSFSGASVIFLFILGLNCFKTSFKFVQANNISRKVFYLGNIIAIVSISGIIALIDFIIDRIFVSCVSYAGIFEQIYTSGGFFDKVLWSVAILTFATSLGWIITMIYYRCNSLMKSIVSLSPVVIAIVFGYFNRLTYGDLGEAITNFLGSALGLTNGLNPYMAVLSFTIATMGIFGLSYLLLYKAPIRE